MARAVEWTQVGLADLADAAEFISTGSRFYAASLVREAREAAATLSTLTERARVVPEADRPDVRELFIQSYRLIFQVTPTHVYVLAFVHGARDLEALWKRYSEHLPPA